VRPLDADEVRRSRFATVERGYDPREVDTLLERLAAQLDHHQAELTGLRRRLRDAEARLAAALEAEAGVQRRLATADRAASTALDDARSRADELTEAVEREALDRLHRAEQDAAQRRSAAEEEAAALLARAREEAAVERRRAERLRDLRLEHREAYREHLRRCLEDLDGGVRRSD
jgi:DivIVA domain-containing protein